LLPGGFDVRIRRFAGVVVLAVGLGLAASPNNAGAAESLPPLVTTLQAVLDGVDDVINTVTSSLFDNPAADITRASVEYAPGWIRMKVQLETPIDPLRDRQWSDASYIEWAFDTNGDGAADYTVEFGTSNEELYGAVFDGSKPVDAESVCDADSAGYSATDGYTVVFDPACIGKPPSLGYAVAMFLDTNPEDDNAPLAADRVPDQGFKPVDAPVQPGEAPASAPATPIAPHAVPMAPAAPAPAASTPAAPKPPAASTPPVPKPPAGAAPAAPAPAAPKTPAAAPVGGTGAITPPAAGSGRVSPPATAPSASAPSNLAHTGSPSQQKALLGFGLMLLGAGMLVMAGPNRRRRCA
jgi:hypothetical protein